jgi:hypothetical protein
MLDMGTKRLSGFVKLLLDLVFAGGIFICISLPFTLKWYFNLLSNTSGENYYFMMGFLYVTGFFCLSIVYELRKIFKTLTGMNPFIMENVKSLKSMAISAFVISICYIVKVLFYNTILTMIVTMIFVIAGLFSIILSEVFRQAVIYKEENDLTI